MNACKKPTIPLSIVLAVSTLLPVADVRAELPKNTVAEQLVMSSEGFLASHPDLRWRREGLFAYERGEPGEAARYFKRAAEFADKPSQAVYAELLWRGEGVEQDRVLAYAWMDLAAERGYRLFVAKREGFWAELDAAERQRALRDGPAIYDRYGDDVAKPRLNRLLTKGRQGVTGSRVGHVGKIDIMLPGPARAVSGGTSPETTCTSSDSGTRRATGPGRTRHGGSFARVRSRSCPWSRFPTAAPAPEMPAKVETSFWSPSPGAAAVRSRRQGTFGPAPSRF